MLNKIFSYIIVASILIAPIQVRADPKFTILQAGQEAPFSGVLYDMNANAKILGDRVSFFDEMNLKLKKLEEGLVLKHNFNIKSLKVTYESEIGSLEKSLQIKNQQLEEVSKVATKGSNNLLWGILIGTGGGVGVTLLTIFIVNKGRL